MSETISRNGIDYRIIPLDSCLDVAMGLKDAGKRWHSHVLSPRCAHNPYDPDDELYAIVIEDDASGVAYIAPSRGFPEIDKSLVKILHGDDILDASKSTAGRDGGIAESSDLLKRLIRIDGEGIAWHHHMNFPDCVFNPHPGRWAITVESEAGTFSESFDDEPVDVLREVEVLYFRNLAAKG